MPVARPCNGGWWDALEFAAEFLVAGVLIEGLSWVRWILREKSSSTISSVEQAEVTLSGGRLLFVPQNLFWNLVFVGACFGLFKLAGSPDACETAIFAWRNALGAIAFAYGTLSLVSFGRSLYPE
jgi:hypothetical protein